MVQFPVAALWERRTVFADDNGEEFNLLAAVKGSGSGGCAGNGLVLGPCVRFSGLESAWLLVGAEDGLT